MEQPEKVSGFFFHFILTIHQGVDKTKKNNNNKAINSASFFSKISFTEKKLFSVPIHFFFIQLKLQ